MDIDEIKKIFKYNTLDYVLKSEIGEVLVNDGHAFISKYFDTQQNILIYRYALDDVKYLIDVLQKEKTTYLIPFVHKEFVAKLEKIGLSIRSMFKGFFKFGFNDFELVNQFDFLDISESEKAALLTQKAINTSRGFFGQTKQWIEGWILGTIDDIKEIGVKNQQIIVKRDKDKIIGLICIGLYGFDKENGPTLWVRELVVDQDYQGQKIGQTLLQEGLGYGKLLNAKKAFLLVDELNNNAIHIYKKYGFCAADEDAQIDMIYDAD